MKTPPTDHLPDDITALKQQLLAQHQLLQTQHDQLEIKEQLIHHNQVLLSQKQSRIQFLEEQIILFKQRQFGKSSEKSDQQTELFDEVECEGDVSAPEIAESIEAEVITAESDAAPSAPKKTSGRKPLPAVLPRVRIEHDLTEADKLCACGCAKTCIGEDTSEQLDIIPTVVQVLVHARKKYACKACENGVQIAALPKQPLPKSNASPGLLAHIAVAKYQDGLPLYRMETIFKRMGIHLPRNTLANWMIKSSELLQPLYNLLNDQLLDSGYIHMDETRVQVLKEPDKKAESLSYMWVRRSGGREHPIILFDYASSRRADVAASLLGDYQGYLQTDDYAGYHRIGQQKGIVALGSTAGLLHLTFAPYTDGEDYRVYILSSDITKDASINQPNAVFDVTLDTQTLAITSEVSFVFPTQYSWAHRVLYTDYGLYCTQLETSGLVHIQLDIECSTPVINEGGSDYQQYGIGAPYDSIVYSAD